MNRLQTLLSISFCAATPSAGFAIDTCDADFDTQIAVYTGGCDSLICVTGNDDFCGIDGIRSTVHFNPTFAGAKYFIVVFGFGWVHGSFTLKSTCAPNDPCASTPDVETPCCGNGVSKCNICCDGATPVTGNVCCEEDGSAVTGNPCCEGGTAVPVADNACCEGDGNVVPDTECCLSGNAQVGRCRLTVSKPVLKAPLVSALETNM